MILRAEESYNLKNEYARIVGNMTFREDIEVFPPKMIASKRANQHGRNTSPRRQDCLDIEKVGIDCGTILIF